MLATRALERDDSVCKMDGRRPHHLKLDILLRETSVTTSTTSITQSRSVNLQFSELSYSVKTGIRRESKCVLKRISGEFQSGELTAIMGPSGAGKSSLMNILAGYTTRNVTGSVLVNGLERDLRRYQKLRAYIMQDDKLQPLLTVHEAMSIAANLKLGSQTSQVQKQERITEILDALGLLPTTRTMTGALSGGQRKRLAIALELVNNPPVMFFDEPTSGLDSSMSAQCATVLKLLAREGRTIVCTIHQPSASLLEMFDHLYILGEGHCLYQGSVKGMLPFLMDLGLECPPYHNPADFVLEVSTGDYGNHNKNLSAAINNGKCNDWRRRPTDRLSSIVQEACRGPLTPVRPTALPPSESLTEQGFRVFPISPWLQFYILLKRTFLLTTRDRTLSQMRLIMHVVIGLLIGLLYYRVGNDAAYVFDNFGLLFFNVMFLMFTSFMSMLLTFPSEVPIIAREYFNRWYSLKMYYLAVTFADVPLQTVCTVGYSTVVYLMTSQPLDLYRFFLYVLVSALVAVVAQSIGMVIGVSMSVQNGMVFGPLGIMPFFIFSGFFVQMKDAPSYFHWLFHLSYVKYGMEGVLLSVYSYGRERLDCSIEYCHFRSPTKFLESVDMGHDSYWFNVSILVVMFILLRFLSYVFLLYRLSNKV